MCSLRLIVTAIANPPDLKFGHEGLHGDIQTFHSDLVDMHKLTPHIEELIEFEKRLLLKLN
jgi:hypothetical protein